MNARFLGLSAWPIVLSVCLQITFALSENISKSSSDDEFNRENWLRNGEDRMEKNHLEWLEIKVQEPKENCTERSMDDFPADIFTIEQRRHGAVLVHAFFGFYCFILTAFVCNDYLLPSLECICAGMRISKDVAGATFLATASCFPELFVNVVGTFITESDLGVGTVVGGAVFNTLATPACGALSALHGIQLEWRILSRDCIIYVISVVTLVAIMWDGLIVWYEATILMALFAIYLILLFCGKSIAHGYRKIAQLCSGGSAFSHDNSSKKLGADDEMPDGSYKSYHQNDAITTYRKSLSKAVNQHGQHHLGRDLEESNQTGSLEKAEDGTEVEPDTPFVWPRDERLAVKCWFLFTWPLKFLLFVTIPDTRYERCKQWYPLTFLMCVVWIAITSYLTSWMMTVVGDTIGIPDSIMGITFLSAGGNMPELVSIIILSRQGYGDMAMSNTLGANTLDILLCLGLPWIIKCIMTGRSVEIISGTLTYSISSIVICVIILYGVTALCKFKLNKKVGIICLLLYLIFLIFAILVELNVFFHVNLPMCDY